MNYKKTPITEAINNTKIEHQTEKSFNDFMILNCRLYSIPIPGKTQMRVIYDYVKKSMSALTFEELTLALEMNLNGQFKTRIEPFQVFSLPFLTKIIEQYRPVRQHELKHNRLPDSQPRTVTNAEKVHDEFLESCTKMKEILMFNNWTLIYRHLTVLKETPTEKEFMSMCAQERGKVMKSNRGIVGDEITLKTVERVQKLICQDYAYQKLRGQGVSVTPHDI